MTPGRYRLSERLDTGELAELFRVERVDAPGGDSHHAVIKLFHAHTSDAAYAHAFAKVIRVLQARPLEGVAPVLEIGQVGDRLAIVRDDPGPADVGRLLQRLNTREAPWTPLLGLGLTLDLAQVVGRAHEVGVLHGALTPANVLLSRAGAVAVCDFGALEALRAAPELNRTFGDRGRGSYRAPELGRDDQPSVATDVYSIGAIAYELLTRKEPNLKAHLSTRREALVPPSRIDRRINARLDPIVLRAIEQSPARRYRTAGDFVAAVRDYLAKVGGAPSSADLAHLLEMLFPASAVTIGAASLPFSESFAIEEVTGIAAVVTSRAAAVPERPSFAEIDEAPTETAQPVIAEPSVEPARVGSAEAWHAPPAAFSSPTKKGERHDEEAVARRLRVVGDLSRATSTPPQLAEASDTEEVQASSPAVARAVPNTVPDQPVVEAAPGGLPSDTRESLPGVASSRSHRWLWLALAPVVVAIGGTIYVSNTSRESEPPEKSATAREDRVVRDLDSKFREAFEQSKPPATPSGQPGERSEGGWHVPARGTPAYLTINSDVSAVVLIDGLRVRRTTPLNRYPVQPGDRKIVLIDGATGERREFSMLLQRGQVRKVEEQFRTGARRKNP